MDNQIEIQFGAELGDMEAGGAEAKSIVESIQAAVASLGAAFSAMGTQAVGAFKEVGASAQQSAAAVKEVGEAIEGFRTAIAGIGEAFIAAFAVEQITQFAESMGHTAEQIQHVAIALGTSTGEVQELKGLAAGLGIPFESLETAALRSSKALTQAREGSKQAGEAFKVLGINVNDAVTPVDLLKEEIDKLNTVPDQVTKIGIAYQLFGRNLTAIAPLLGITSAEMATLNEKLIEYGVRNDVAQQKGLALSHAFQENQIAMQGMGNIITDALAPVMAQLVDGVNKLILGFISSYKEGGIAKTMMDELAIALKAAASGVAALIAFLEALTLPFVAVTHGAMAFWDALHGDTLGVVKNLAAIQDGFRGIGDTISWAMGLWTKGAAKLPDLPKPHPAANPPDLKTNKPHHEKGLESELDKLKDKLDELENKHNDTIQDMTAVELTFWQGVASNGPLMASLSQADAATVNRTVMRLTHEEAMKGIETEMASEKDAAASAIADAKAKYVATSAAIQNEIKDTEDAEKRGVISRADATAKILTLIQQQKDAAIQAAELERSARETADDLIMARSDRGTSQYRDALADKLKAEAEFNAQRVAADKVASDAIQAQTRKDADAFKQEWDKALKSWESAVKPFVSTFSQGIEQMITGAKSFGQVMAQVGSQILNDFVSKLIEPMVTKWIAGVFLRAQAEQTGFMGTIVRDLAQMLGIHLSTEAAKTGATVAGVAARTAAEVTGAATTTVVKKIANSKDITQDAGEAAAGAYKAIVGIPVIGPALAPAAAAVAFGAVEAFAAAGFDVPFGKSPVTQLHPEEMVLPKAVADPVRRMASAMGTGAAGGASGGLGGGPTVHLHVQAMDADSFLGFMRGNMRPLQTVLGEMVQGGMAGKMGLATA